ncbi:MAG: hypothetical protein QOF92_3610 [Pseudonocardiales bacterium]|nr:hypothetical protein [Pseudonocardiales bacterium]
MVSGALAAVLLWAVLAPGAAATPTLAPSASTHSVPPAAPQPTDSGNSPAVPDPHPPRGGRGPDGEPVGGARLLSRNLVLPEGAPALPADLTAQAWVVVDLDQGDILAARDPHGRYQPASIQKVLTAVALLPQLPGQRKITVSRQAASTEGSHAGLVGGGRYTIDQVFEGLLLVSGNDSAEALAEAAGGRAKTVTLMNRTALGLGAYDTYVQTPSGLDGWQQLTSAYDMALFLRAALGEARFVRYDTVSHARLPAQKVGGGFGPVNLDNQNQQFLTTVKGALVAKTGFTDAAQHTFVGAINRGGHRYGVVLLRAQRYPDDQWVQATKLVDWARALPAGTKPVGRLAGPADPAQARADTAAAGPSAATSSRRAAAAGVASGGGAADGGTPLVVQLLVVLALVGGAVAFGWRLVRRR